MQKGVLLLSSGIDSPVAGHLMLKKGVELVCLHFSVGKKSDETTKKLIKKLREHSQKPIKAYFVPHTDSLKAIREKADSRYTCVLCKRLMLKTAERVAEKEQCGFLITGESLGQVASQTIKNMVNLDTSVKTMILRPLLCNDKEETVKIAKEIGTFGISSEDTGSCFAVPPNPITKSRIEKVKEEEEKINVDKMIEKALSEAEVMEI